MDSSYTIALDQALAWIMSSYEISGIIVSGSIVREDPDENSDFDIYVIHEGSFRQRIQKRFNGVPCEIFVNNLEQVYTYFENELTANRPVSANMIATGQLVKGNDNQKILTLVEDAKKYAVLSRPLTEEQLTIRKYIIATLFEDVADTIVSDKITALYILDKVITEIIDFVFAVNQQPLPGIKDRIKMLLLLDPTAGPLIEKYFTESSVEQKFRLVKEIILILTGKTEFFEWSSAPQ